MGRSAKQSTGDTLLASILSGKGGKAQKKSAAKKDDSIGKAAGQPSSKAPAPSSGPLTLDAVRGGVKARLLAVSEQSAAHAASLAAELEEEAGGVTALVNQQHGKTSELVEEIDTTMKKVHKQHDAAMAYAAATLKELLGAITHAKQGMSGELAAVTDMTAESVRLLRQKHKITA